MWCYFADLEMGGHGQSHVFCEQLTNVARKCVAAPLKTNLTGVFHRIFSYICVALMKIPCPQHVSDPRPPQDRAGLSPPGTDRAGRLPCGAVRRVPGPHRHCGVPRGGGPEHPHHPRCDQAGPQACLSVHMFFVSLFGPRLSIKLHL